MSAKRLGTRCDEQPPKNEVIDPFASAAYDGASSGKGIELGKPILGRFTPEEFLGRGQFFSVYRAFDDLLGRHVAIKTARGESATGIQSLAMLGRELRIQRQLESIRVVRLYDVHCDSQQADRIHFGTMELASGGSLRQWLQDRNEDGAARTSGGLEVFLEICRGCAELHAEGFCLLDLKPENILFFSGQPKLSDLGLAVHLDEIQSGKTELSIPAALRGTPAYMSPEQSMSHSLRGLGPASDVYSLALIGCEILHPGFRHNTGGKLTRDSPVRGAYVEIPGMSREFCRVMARGLDPAPGRRYPDAGEFLRALEASGRSQEEDLSPATISCATPSQSRPIVARRGGGSSRKKHTGADAEGTSVRETALTTRKVGMEEMPRQHADKLLQRILEAESLWDVTTLCDFAREVAERCPGDQRIAVALLDLKYRETRYLQLVEDAQQSLVDMDVEVARSLLKQAVELNPANVKVRRALQVVSWFLKSIKATLQQDASHTRSSSHLPTLCSYTGNLDSLGEEVAAYVGVLLESREG